MINNEQNLNHLKLLGIFHYIVGGIALLMSLMPIAHLVIGIIFIISPDTMTGQGEPPPDFIGYLFAGMGALFFIVGVAFSVCILLSGKYLRSQKKYQYSFVMACIECIFMPFGTVLGIFTIIVLSKDPVKKLYELEVEDNS